MNAVCRFLGNDLNIKFNTLVKTPRRDSDQWRLADNVGQELGSFDLFVTTAPAPQAAEHLACVPDLAQLAKSIGMDGCWAAMLAFDRSLPLSFDGAFVGGSPLSRISRNNSKPARNREPETWVLHATPEWTRACIDATPDSVLPALIDAFWEATGLEIVKPTFAAPHRWRYAISPEPLEQQFLFDPIQQVGSCGDWCGGPRVEGAFLSGAALADQIAKTYDER
jgi:predicted NAD/FAD-dependent oxidoreductase